MIADGREYYQFLLKANPRMTANEASRLVIAADMGADIGADRTQAVAPAIVASGQLIKDLAFTAAGAGLTGGPAIVVAEGLELGFVAANVVIGSAQGAGYQAGRDVAREKLSGPGTYLKSVAAFTSGNLLVGSAAWLVDSLGGSADVVANEVDAEVPRGTTGAESAVNARRLAQQLTRQEASSAFTPGGALHSEVLARSRPIIPGSQIQNPAVIRELTADGSRIADWAKFSTETLQSPSGPFQVHFYRNVRTGTVNYTIDYKAVFNQGVQP